MIKDKRIQGGILVFLGACSFGILSTIVKTAYNDGYLVGQITGSQYMFGALVLWMIYFIQKFFRTTSNSHEGIGTQALYNKKNNKWWKILIAGSFSGLCGVFYYNAVTILPASIAIILLMQYLWISILIEALIFKKKPSSLQLIAVVIVLGGTILAGGIFSESVHLNIKGVVYGLLAATSYSIFLMASGRLGNDLPIFKKSALMITGSCLLIFLIYPPLFIIDGTLVSGLYKWGLMLAFFGTIITPLLFSKGIPLVGVSLGAILCAAELPVAVISSRFILKENVSFVQWVGVALILLAIVVTNLKVKKNKV